MREITTHKGNELDDALRIQVIDEPGPGGACHHYQITGIDPVDGGFLMVPATVISFQRHPVKEAGVNGISIESLLAICIDRLEGFQSGPYRNTHNGNAHYHLEEALAALKRRTGDRQSRGVEGTSAP